MSSGLPREAATLMRQRAEAADRYWNADVVPGDSLHLWVPDYDPSDPSGQTAMQRVVGGAESPLAEHIASWHPAVALAVADWLDACLARDPRALGTEAESALAVARAYLGRES